MKVIHFFRIEKEKMIDMLNHFMDEYEKFTKSVSPKNWKSTGRHFTELKEYEELILKKKN